MGRPDAAPEAVGAAEAFSKPAQTGLLPQTVPEDEIQQARAATATMETVAEFAGPALATVLTIAGSIVAFRWRPRYPMRVGMAFCLLWPLSTLAFAAALPLPVVVALFVVCGAGLALFGVWWDTALAERMPPHLLSRVSAYDWMGSLALVPFGYLIAGPLGEALGSREVMVGGALVSIAVLTGGLLVRDTWTLRRLERAPA